MTSVEKMAIRLLSRHNLQPPFNLDTLVAHYASVEYRTDFPENLSADGVTIGKGGENKPQVLINAAIPETRKRFTLAHELGHIIIPWHTGTIVSQQDYVDANSEYREMESEANQFAAELLIPQYWLQNLEKKYKSLELFIKRVLTDTEVSRDAALIKIFGTISTSVICVWIDDEGKAKKLYRTDNAPKMYSLSERNFFEQKIFSTATLEENFNLKDRVYKSWTFGTKEFLEQDSRPWRDVLNQILNETGKKELLLKVNGVLAAKYNSNKDKIASEQELCSLAIQAYDGRDEYRKIVVHPLFPQYVIKRIKELMNKNLTR